MAVAHRVNHWTFCLTTMLAIAVVTAACEPEQRVVHRDNCLTCHTPIDKEGLAHGIESAHPWPVAAGTGSAGDNGTQLSCVDCHGGNPRICDGTASIEDGEPACDEPWVYDQDRAHVHPGNGPRYLKNLSPTELDAVDLDYLQFINPGDFRVLERTCGQSGCHEEAADIVPRSSMAHTAGEIAVARYRAGAQPDPYGRYGAVAVTDPNPPDPAVDACAVAMLEVFDPPPIDVNNLDVASAQDQYMVKSCFRCHLNDFGQNRFPGDFRSSGCTACHMGYADDGLSVSADPMINKQTVPHPKRHEMTKSPPIETCTHCHYRGGRLGISYQGYRESAGPGLNPDNPEALGVDLHGHDAGYYLVDEDTTNDWDETPPDVHFEAGMHCVDCHTVEDVHGSGHLYGDTQCAVRTSCEDCHGTVRVRASVSPNRDNLFERDGKLWLATKVTGLELEVPQVADSVDKDSPSYNYLADVAMGVNDQDFSHTDEVECYTCHAAFIPSCYGCHVTIDLDTETSYHTTGASLPGKPTGKRKWVTLNDLVLMRNSEGKMAPSMPAERFFMTVERGDEVLLSEPRTFTFPDGRKIAGFGQRAFNPHSTRRLTQFSACDRCHTTAGPDGTAANAPNEILMDLTHGFGTQRFPETACDVSNDDLSCDPDTDHITYQLDAIQTRDGKPLVAVGHDDPVPSRPLTLDEIQRMRDIVLDPPLLSTEIPDDAATNPNWPAASRSQ